MERRLSVCTLLFKKDSCKLVPDFEMNFKNERGKRSKTIRTSFCFRKMNANILGYDVQLILFDLLWKIPMYLRCFGVLT